MKPTEAPPYRNIFRYPWRGNAWPVINYVPDSNNPLLPYYRTRFKKEKLPFSLAARARPLVGKLVRYKAVEGFVRYVKAQYHISEYDIVLMLTPHRVTINSEPWTTDIRALYLSMSPFDLYSRHGLTLDDIEITEPEEEDVAMLLLSGMSVPCALR